jgi:hypothetical protein
VVFGGLVWSVLVVVFLFYFLVWWLWLASVFSGCIWLVMACIFYFIFW